MEAKHKNHLTRGLDNTEKEAVKLSEKGGNFRTATAESPVKPTQQSVVIRPNALR